MCRGQHEAFSHVAGFQVEISRRLVLYDDGILVIADQWKAEEPISCSLALTLHPSVTPRVAENGALLQDGDGNAYPLTIQHFPTPSEETSEALPVPLRVVKGHYSPAYGVIGETDYLECDFGISREGRVLTTVSRAGNISADDLARVVAMVR